MGIRLEPVSIENWYACTQLRVKAEQLDVFPAPVVYWIAESKYVDDFKLRSIYSVNDLVGFIVFCSTPDKDGNNWIPALMIDHQHQGKGYGRTAMIQIIELMKQMGATRIMIGHRPDNLVAGTLYESLGFKRISKELVDGEIVRLLEV